MAESRTEAAQRFAIHHIFAFSEDLGYGEVVEALVADGDNFLPFKNEVLAPCEAYESFSAESLLVELEALYIGAETLLEQFSGEENN